MGGVDTKHDHLVGQLPIQLTSKLGRATIQAGEEWDEAANRRYTLAWFKESVILSLCSWYTSRKQHSSHISDNQTLPVQSLKLVTQHQVQPMKNLESSRDKGRCLICKLLNVQRV